MAPEARMRGLLLLLMGLLLGAAQAAEIYKWTDDKGRTHYSDRPPPSSDVKTVRRDMPPEGAELSDPAAAEAGASEAADAPNAVAEAVQPTPCDEARAALRRLEQEVSVRMDLDGDGVAEVLDANARLQQIQIARDTLQQRCQDGAAS
jgi:hypothetical protein